MKIAYAFRRSIYYPYRGDPRGLPERDVRARLFAKIRETGFEAVELGVDMVGGPDAEEGPVTELRKELEDYGTPCAIVRGDRRQLFLPVCVYYFCRLTSC